jgi:hypothetical protein
VKICNLTWKRRPYGYLLIFLALASSPSFAPIPIPPSQITMAAFSTDLSEEDLSQPLRIWSAQLIRDRGYEVGVDLKRGKPVTLFHQPADGMPVRTELMRGGTATSAGPSWRSPVFYWLAVRVISSFDLGVETHQLVLYDDQGELVSDTFTPAKRVALFGRHQVDGNLDASTRYVYSVRVFLGSAVNVNPMRLSLRPQIEGADEESPPLIAAESVKPVVFDYDLGVFKLGAERNTSAETITTWDCESIMARLIPSN